MRPLISVIVPVRNGESTIKKCLDSLFELNYPEREVIIVDDGSTDGTGEILRGYDGCQVLETGGIGPSRARNMAVQQAKGEYVAFTDADCIVDPDWLSELLVGFTEDRIAGVGGDQQSPKDETDFGRDVQSFFKAVGFVVDYVKSGRSLIETPHNPSCNVMYRKGIFEEVGNFREDLWPGEDIELDHRIRRAGHRLLFNPSAVVYHYRPRNLRAFARMMWRYGRVQAHLLKRYGFFRKILFEPLILVGLLGILIAVSIIDPRVALAAALVVFLGPLVYFLLRGKGTRMPFLFYLTLLGWNAGFVWGLLSKAA